MDGDGQSRTLLLAVQGSRWEMKVARRWGCGFIGSFGCGIGRQGGKATVARTHAYGNKMAVAGAYSHGDEEKGNGNLIVQFKKRVIACLPQPAARHGS
jgi:hypothetical protein